MRFFAIAALLLASCQGAFSAEPNVVIEWNNATLQGIRDAKLGAPVVARALAIVHTCMYDAWAAYDGRAVGTQLSGAGGQTSDLDLPNSHRTKGAPSLRSLQGWE